MNMGSVSVQLLGAAAPRLFDLWRAGPIAALAGAMAVFAALWVRQSRSVRRAIRMPPSHVSSVATDAPAGDASAATAARPPVILLGGEANALSVARDLGRTGVTVFAMVEPRSSVPYSRYCRRIGPAAVDDCETAWAEFLLSDAARPYH